VAAWADNNMWLGRAGWRRVTAFAVIVERKPGVERA
jgi:hypothetical protein